jgi:hypothetical protein
LNWPPGFGSGGVGSTVPSNTISNEGEIGAGDSCCVSEVHCDGEVAKVGFIKGIRGREVIGIGCGEGISGNLSVFSGQIANLTGLRKGCFACGRLEMSIRYVFTYTDRYFTYLATNEGIQMTQGTSAVTITRDWSSMDVIDW